MQLKPHCLPSDSFPFAADCWFICALTSGGSASPDYFVLGLVVKIVSPFSGVGVGPGHARRGFLQYPRPAVFLLSSGARPVRRYRCRIVNYLGIPALRNRSSPARALAAPALIKIDAPAVRRRVIGLAFRVATDVFAPARRRRRRWCWSRADFASSVRGAPPGPASSESLAGVYQALSGLRPPLPSSSSPIFISRRPRRAPVINAMEMRTVNQASVAQTLSALVHGRPVIPVYIQTSMAAMAGSTSIGPRGREVENLNFHNYHRILQNV